MVDFEASRQLPAGKLAVSPDAGIAVRGLLSSSRRGMTQLLPPENSTVSRATVSTTIKRQSTSDLQQFPLEGRTEAKTQKCGISQHNGTFQMAHVLCLQRKAPPSVIPTASGNDLLRSYLETARLAVRSMQGSSRCAHEGPPFPPREKCLT
ncbi:hypothetical protein OPT61_g3450 [Boeremia exigua]|uniref:Uncharacterized protein n=1 Tax=Boeremia exigua TaxID=749465 RepID=A0ACC2IHV9_9PLEO|nr:hypothetical protein OPT61_g3450 [Boeremia exigua]